MGVKNEQKNIYIQCRQVKIFSLFFLPFLLNICVVLFFLEIEFIVCCEFWFELFLFSFVFFAFFNFVW